MPAKKTVGKKTTGKKMTKQEQIEKRWKRYQELLGYTDKELATFRSFPQNVKAIEDSPDMVKYDYIFEVVEARNCIAGYKLGDYFRVDPFGFLMKEECPKNLCTGMIFAFKPLVGYAWQALMDSSGYLFHRTIRCPDVGVEREGSGEVMVKLYLVPRGEKWVKPKNPKDIIGGAGRPAKKAAGRPAKKTSGRTARKAARS